MSINQKLLIRLLVGMLLGLNLLAACTVNINSNQNANVNRAPAAPPATGTQTSAPAAKAHWTAAVCSSRAGEVTMQAGPSKTDSQTFATWKTGDTQKIFELPARVQNLSEVHFRAIASEDQSVELCVLYDGRPKKRVGFNEGNEEHIVKAGDDDDNNCRCTQ